MDKRFLMIGPMTIAGIASILLFGRGAGHSSVPATDLAAAALGPVKAGRVCGHRTAWP
ncbi:hypothetical protein ACVIWU_006585 [Bradyrhizobium sp. USDA 4509]